MKKLTQAALDALVTEALVSPRGRKHLNIHQHYEDPCQRLFNAIGVESYIRPHRHRLDPKAETLIAIRGRFALLRFDDAGRILGVVHFAAVSASTSVENVGVVLAPGDWHTVLAAEHGSVLLEIKAGPFDPHAAKEYAEWAPAEDSPHAGVYLAALRARAFASTGGQAEYLSSTGDL